MKFVYFLQQVRHKLPRLLNAARLSGSCQLHSAVQAGKHEFGSLSSGSWSPHRSEGRVGQDSFRCRQWRSRPAFVAGSRGRKYSGSEREGKRRGSARCSCTGRRKKQAWGLYANPGRARGGRRGNQRFNESSGGGQSLHRSYHKTRFTGLPWESVTATSIARTLSAHKRSLA